MIFFFTLQSRLNCSLSLLLPRLSMPYSKRKTRKREEGLRRQEGDREDNCGTASLRWSRTNRQQMKPASRHRSFFSRVDRNTPQGHAGDISLTWTTCRPLRMEQQWRNLSHQRIWNGPDNNNLALETHQTMLQMFYGIHIHNIPTAESDLCSWKNFNPTAVKVCPADPRMEISGDIRGLWNMTID